MELQWETIQLSKDLTSSTHRLLVLGGWLVKCLTVVRVVENEISRLELKVNVQFVADPGHHWIVDKVEIPVHEQETKKAVQ